MNCDLIFQERFGEDVRCHVLSRAELDVDMPIGNGLTYKMKANVDMFGMSMVIVVCSEMNCSLIVTVKNSGHGRGSEERLDKSSEPDTFLGGVHACHVFSLSGG